MTMAEIHKLISKAHNLKGNARVAAFDEIHALLFPKEKEDDSRTTEKK